MTDDMRTSTVDESAPKAIMGEFSHANPHTGRTFGQESAFERGPAVAADGGRAEATPEDEADEQTMEDVDHEHPHEDAGDANRVFARGHDSSPDDGDDEDDTV